MWRVQVILAGCAIPLAVAASRPSQAGAIQVRPIIVCDTASSCPGGDPADPNSAYARLFNQATLDRVFAQTAGADFTGTIYSGVSFQVQRPVTFVSPGFSTVDVDVAGNPIDSAHLLIRGAGHLQAPDTTTLNVFLVDTIRLVSAGTAIGSVPGYGLISGNGLVLGVNANPDTLAHELGHGLGLAHVDRTASDDPNNLMRSANRTVPSSPADSRLAGSIDLLSGTAVNDQIRKANQPLFTVNLASASIGTSMADCKPGARICGLGIISNVAPTTESLIGVRLRWTDAGALDSTVIDTPLHGVSGLSRAISDKLGCDGTDFSTTLLANPGGAPGVELHGTFPAGCLSPGSTSGFAFEFPGEILEGGKSLTFTAPFSVQFDFANGSTSVAGYDATTGASTASTIAISAIDRTQIPDGLSIEGLGAQPVTEPGTWMLVAFALASSALFRPAARGRRHPIPQHGDSP